MTNARIIRCTTKNKSVEVHALDMAKGVLVHVFFIDDIGPYYVKSVVLSDTTAEFCDVAVRQAVDGIIAEFDKKSQSYESADVALSVNMFGVKYKNDVN